MATLTVTVNEITYTLETKSNHMWLSDEDGRVAVGGRWSSGSALSGRDAWCRRGESGGDFVRHSEDLSRSRRSGLVWWLLDSGTTRTHTGKFRGDRFTVTAAPVTG